jgi:S1-C subfamily serine protease
MRILLSLLVVLLTSLAQAGDQDLINATMRVKTTNGNISGWGSAVGIDLTEFGMEGNYALTAAHVVVDKGKLEEKIEVEVWVPEVNARAWVSAEVVAYDEEIDVALLKVSVRIAVKAKLAKAMPMIGDPLVAAGCPRGTPVSLSRGHLLDMSRWSGSAEGSMTIDHGNSGGPAFDASGDVIGLVVAGKSSGGYEMDPNWCKITALTVIRPWLLEVKGK